MVEIYHGKDGDLSNLRSITIGIIVYGNQGRVQALNLRDSGFNVIIGNIKDKYRNLALDELYNDNNDS